MNRSPLKEAYNRGYECGFEQGQLAELNKRNQEIELGHLKNALNTQEALIDIEPRVQITINLKGE